GLLRLLWRRGARPRRLPVVPRERRADPRERAGLPREDPLHRPLARSCAGLSRVPRQGAERGTAAGASRAEVGRVALPPRQRRPAIAGLRFLVVERVAAR